jgi:hypothetical protein
MVLDAIVLLVWLVSSPASTIASDCPRKFVSFPTVSEKLLFQNVSNV